MYLADTNVLSELRKGPRCHAAVADWFASVRDVDVYVSVIVFGEIRRGIERIRRRDPSQADDLSEWLRSLEETYATRTLPVDRAVADRWGRLSAPRPMPDADGLLAATATVHGLTLVTRNVRDFAATGVQIHNPFET